MSAAIPAYRDFSYAASYFLAHSSDLPTRFRYDAPARTWRRLTPDGRWRVVAAGEVFEAAKRALHEALDAPVPPLEFRTVHAAPEDADRLAATTSWDDLVAQVLDAHRAAWEADEAHKESKRDALEALLAIDPADLPASEQLTAYLRRSTAERDLARLAPTSYRPPAPADVRLIDPRQRHRLLQSVSGRAVREAVMSASHEEPFRYVAEAAPADVDPRAWLASLPRVHGSVVLSSALYAAYADALPAGARPLHERAFHALAVEVLGDGDEGACRTRRKGLRYYVDLSLPGDVDQSDTADTAGPPHLRLVSGG